MQAVILAAGEGIRLGRESIVPKCLLRVGKKTIIEHTLSQLPKEIHEIIVVVDHLKSQIKRHIGSSSAGRRIKYVEQPEQLGTGHALFVTKDAIGGDKFLVMMGDDLYVKKDIENCLRHDLALLAQRVEAPERRGIIKIDEGFLQEIIESPKLTAESLINCGLYVLDKRIFNYPLVAIGENEYGLPQTIAKMSRQHPVKIEKASFWLPVNTLQDLKKADKYLKKMYL